MVHLEVQETDLDGVAAAEGPLRAGDVNDGDVFRFRPGLALIDPDLEIAVPQFRSFVLEDRECFVALREDISRPSGLVGPDFGVSDLGPRIAAEWEKSGLPRWLSSK